jgi:nitroreductase
MNPSPRPAGSRRALEVRTERLDRRRFLILLGGAAAHAAIGPRLAWSLKLGRHRPSRPWALPLNPPTNPIELARALVGAAVLAPSDWNSQPWRMEVEGNSVRLVADPQRALPVTDPDRTGMMISLGAALENLLIAMRAYGLRPTVTYFPDGDRPRAVAEVSWVNGDLRRDRELFAAIPNRRTNRRGYDGRGIFMQNRAALTAQVSDDLRLHWMDDREQMRAIADLVHDATRSQILDPASQAERMSWMRFGDDEARERGDGVSVDALELGGPARWFAGRYFNPKSRWLGLGANSAAKQAREAIRSAGAMALFTTTRRTESLCVTCGQVYQRFALKATRLGIAHQPMSAPIEVEACRGDLLRSFRAGGEQPLMLVRLGHAKAPRPSVRRSVALVATFRNS